MYLKITDGTTTIDLMGNDEENSFNLLASTWGPNVARRKQTALGGHQYEDVVETIPLYVKSTLGPDTVLANINKLAGMLDQAFRWSRGENVAAVTIRFSPNSDTDYVEAVILGPDGAGIELPATFGDKLSQNTVDRVVLKFIRRGLWLGSEETVNRTASTSYNPGIITPSTNFADSNATGAPVKLTLDRANADGANSGVVLISNSSAGVALIQGQTGTRIGVVGTIAETDTEASGGQVGRVVPTSSFQQIGFSGQALGFTSQLANVYISLRNRSATIDHTISASVQTYTAQGSTVIRAGQSDPHVVNLGLVYVGSGTFEFQLIYQASSLGTAADSLDIDVVGLVDVSNGFGKAITVEPIAPLPDGRYLGDDITYDHRALTAPTATIVGQGTAGEAARPDKGDAFVVTDTNSIVMLPIMNKGSYWGMRDTSNVRIPIGMNATRRKGYLVPQ